jgi:aminopeptidase 2
MISTIHLLNFRSIRQLTNFSSPSLDVVEDTSSVSLNVQDLEILSTEINSLSPYSSPIRILNISNDADRQVTTISLGSPLAAQTQVQLAFVFRGKLYDNLVGFYRSRYQDADGETKVLATTQMEPTEARRVFPCFDEPALKAAFSITLIVDKHLSCLSNMDIAAEAEVKVVSNRDCQATKTKKAVKFNRTPAMSTYLLAFVVGELHYAESLLFRVPVRVYAPKRKDMNMKTADFSLDLASNVLQFYETKFGVNYPLPKLDMIAIPDFPAGAMENWGLITYRESDLLFEETDGSIADKLRTAITVQHEIAHMWFGNLVTMDFWDGLWLKEGFATWMSYYACDHFFPSWKVWEQFVAENLQAALSLDSLRSSHPVEMPIQNETEIGQIFDAISYLKGSGLVRMIYSYLGEDDFMAGVRHYLKKHAYANTTTTDLWDSLGHASGIDVMAMMDALTKQVGHPVATVIVSENCIVVRQDRYLRTGDPSPEEAMMLYPVPLNIRSINGENAMVHNISFAERECTIRVDGFVKLNANHTGLYRTCYTSEYLQKLAKEASKGVILSVEDRAGMIADAAILASSGHQKTSDFLQLITHFSHESQYIVWDIIITHLSAIQKTWIFEKKQVQFELRWFIRLLVGTKASELGWNLADSSHTKRKLKALLFSAAGRAGDPVIVDASRKMLLEFSSRRTQIDPDLRPHVFRIALENNVGNEVNEQFPLASISID